MSEKILYISEGSLSLGVSATGAQIKSLKDGSGKEYIWCGDPAVWPKTCPIMFPICGGLKEDAFYYEGKRYSLEKHGFTLTREFEVEKHTDNSLVLLLKSNDEIKAMYPFDFEFRVCFTVKDGAVEVAFSTTNIGTGDMYYTTGAHEGYSCPEGIEAYDVVFDKEEDLYRTVLNGNLIEHKTEKVETDGRALHMKYSHMDNDCLMFYSPISRGVRLLNRNTGKGVRVEFEDFSHLVLWTKKGAPYLCIEPWNGVPDRVDSDMDITHKESMFKLEAGKTQTFVHRIIPIV